MVDEVLKAIATSYIKANAIQRAQISALLSEEGVSMLLAALADVQKETK